MDHFVIETHMLTIIISIVVLATGVAWGYYRGLSKVVTMPTALLLSFFAGKLCSPVASRLFSRTDLFPPLFRPLAASVIPRAVLFLLFYIGGRYVVRQLKKKRHFGAYLGKPELHGTVISGKDFFTSQIGNAPVSKTLSERSYERIERIGGASIGGIGSVILLSMLLAAIGLAGDLQEIAQQRHGLFSALYPPPGDRVQEAGVVSRGPMDRQQRQEPEGLFISMKRDSDNTVMNMLRSAANPIDDQVFTVFKDYMLVVSNPELMERLLNHPGLSRLTEDPRLRALTPAVTDDPDGIDAYTARQRATADLLLDMRNALVDRDYEKSVKNKQLAAILSDEAFLREFTGEFGKVLRDVIDSK